MMNTNNKKLAIPVFAIFAIYFTGLILWQSIRMIWALYNSQELFAAYVVAGIIAALISVPMTLFAIAMLWRIFFAEQDKFLKQLVLVIIVLAIINLIN